MRAIKFRAWVPDEQKMMYFDLTDLDSGTILVDGYTNTSDCEVMEYTGLVIPPESKGLRK